MPLPEVLEIFSLIAEQLRRAGGDIQLADPMPTGCAAGP
jgi:hypothetical protein